MRAPTRLGAALALAIALALGGGLSGCGANPERTPSDFTIVATAGTTFKPVPTKSLFALGLGTNVPADGVVPPPESTAANGPIQGSMVLFRVDDQAIEDRPLILHIPSSSGPAGEVE